MKPKAFTLIELLVVMAIIAMMLGVLVPSLARAKEQGRDVYCQNNLRQMHIAAAVYAENQRGFLPIAYYSVKLPAQRTQYCWDFTECRSSEGVVVQPGLLWQEEMMEKVQQCPSFKGDSNTMANPYTGYNYNTSYIGRGQYEGIVLPVRYHEIRYPAGCAMFGDGQTVNGANKFMRSPLPSETDMNFSGRWGGTQGYRHNQNTNIASCDGSVESRAELFYGTDADGTSDLVRQYNEQNPQNPIGFLSEDNSAYDLRQFPLHKPVPVLYNSGMDKELVQSGMNSLVRPMRKLWRTTCQLLWPALCQACSIPIEEEAGGLCSTCWQELSTVVGCDYCRRCGRAVTRYGLVANRCGGCLEEELEYEGLCRAGFYTGVLKNLLLGLKFRDQTENADYLGPIIRGAFETSGFADKIDILVPVPLHWRRRLERGFNQSYLLARQMRQFCSTISTDLVRMRYTCHQWELENDSARRKNVKDAFAVRHGHPFQGKTVCLVDDITTSGATLKECAVTLRQAGAKAVFAAVVAAAERMD